MSRQTYAAQQLTEEITALRKSAKVEVADDPDGLDVHRAVKLDKETSKALGETLEVVAQNDPRIESVENSGGVVTVTFVAGTEADDRTPFEVENVREVIKAGGKEEEPGV